MMKVTRIITLLVVVWIISGVPPGSACAQPVLISASPAPDSVLIFPPSEIRLEFDRAISREAAGVMVLNEAGERVDMDDMRITETERFVITLSVPVLPNGLYTVSYQVKTTGGSIQVHDSYQFVIQQRPPQLQILVPGDGAAFEAGSPVEIILRVDGVDFDYYESRVHLYVDDDLIADLKDLQYRLDDLEPGVHEIKAILSQSGSELPETINIIHIAIARPDPETEGRLAAASAAPDQGLQLSPLQLTGILALVILLVTAGYWLGRLPDTGML